MCIHLSPCEIKVTNVERLRQEVSEREMVCRERGGGDEREVERGGCV